MAETPKGWYINIEGRDDLPETDILGMAEIATMAHTTWTFELFYDGHKVFEAEMKEFTIWSIEGKKSILDFAKDLERLNEFMEIVRGWNLDNIRSDIRPSAKVMLAHLNQIAGNG